MNDPIVYLNGAYLPRSQAQLSVEERGTLFGDGVYEVTRYYGGRPLGVAEHLARLRRSLGGIRLEEPAAVGELPAISDELLRRNGWRDARVYWQVTRGPAPREHVFPANATPTVLAMAYPVRPFDPEAPVPAWRTITVEDTRWANCWIKALTLLPNALAKQAARDAGCAEAILVRDGRVTEGSGTNVFAVRDGVLWTHPADRWILGGVTRQLVLDLARAEGVPVREEAVSAEALRSADEVLLTGTTTHVAAVTQVDDAVIGHGEPGPVAACLHRAFGRHVREACSLD